jgi:eukaryotic-like serine/threonine-protein kinase
MAEVDTGRCEPLLPGFAVAVAGVGGFGGYDVSRDGSQVVMTAADSSDKLRLWIAPLDRRLPPRQIPDVEGGHPKFGAAGDVFFRRVEGTSAFVYAVQQNGSGLRKVTNLPIAGIVGESLDREWLALSSHTAGGLVLFQEHRGIQLLVKVPPPTKLGWTGDGKHLFVQDLAVEDRANAYVLPLSPGQLVPDSMLQRLVPDRQFVNIPGARIISERDVIPGPTAEVYAFTRSSVQHNLYRIPLP